MKIEENIGRYLFGYAKPPEVNDLVTMSDGMMEIASEMEKFMNNITDPQKQKTMKRNIGMMQQLMVDNLEMYNDWMKETE